jgi:hypothetical protein
MEVCDLFFVVVFLVEECAFESGKLYGWSDRKNDFSQSRSVE